MMTFPEGSDEDLVIKQIEKNAHYWGSDKCKRSTMEKYVEREGVADPSDVVERLIQQGVIESLPRGYVTINYSVYGEKKNE